VVRDDVESETSAGERDPHPTAKPGGQLEELQEGFARWRSQALAGASRAPGFRFSRAVKL